MRRSDKSADFQLIDVAYPLSLAALTVLELSPPDMVSCAKEAGYSHVGLRLIPATDREPTWPIIGDTPLVRELERRLADITAHAG